ncbi:hypothetical protein CLV92_103350 [Kineococcus xinjiangensis]|uniref:DUF4350 domain-containing protein n=1 Tax=Kineococcus xinjiangensis TaxID=512762 RepID=A0A2S6IUK0_9ACTN|nr:DUF4350 domain-containing protein [Kineococcus xinjiangensis]PPK97815.1 hypothetical protein CLV92_103350 [Kineococcus xinjiangensis]
MSAPAETGTETGTGAPPDPGPQSPVRRLDRLRWPLVVAGVVAAVAALLALLVSDTNRLPMHPASVSGDGARAVAQILQRQGVTVERTVLLDDVAERVAEAGGRATVLVTEPDDLAPEVLAELAGLDADLVLLAPTDVSLGALVPGLYAVDDVDRRESEPQCASERARRAGRVSAGGQVYTRDGAADGTDGGTDGEAQQTGARVQPVAVEDLVTCYPAEGGSSYAEASRDGRTITVLGQPALLTNDLLDAQGNASLALSTLGQQPLLLWYAPGPVDTVPADGPSLEELTPRWLLPGIAVVVLAALLALLAAGRRLGRLVTEPLPVVVRAAETVEGRGRLYARADARDRAAQALRAGTLRRCRQRMRLGRSSGPAGCAEVADAVAAATGRHPQEVRALLEGPPPADDAALVRLATELELLEGQLTPGSGAGAGAGAPPNPSTPLRKARRP